MCAMKLSSHTFAAPAWMGSESIDRVLLHPSRTLSATLPCNVDVIEVEVEGNNIR